VRLQPGRAARIVTTVAASLGIALVALAGPPPAERIANAVADQNRVAGRTVALSGQVEIRLASAAGGEEPAARGVLLSDPSGASRLEVRGPGGLVERHLLRGSELRASRGGEPLADPQPFLPPFALLQAASPGELQSRLLELGGRPDEVALGHEGEHDCWVIGGRAAGGDPRPAVWVDLETLEVVRIDRGDGAIFRLGPPAVFGGVRVPGWIEVEAPGEPPARLVVLGVSPATPAPGAFTPAWLTAP
jgi:hypothetical protein